MASLLSAVVLLAVLSSGFCEETVTLQRAGVAFKDRRYRSVLSVTNGERWGSWTWAEMCPENYFAVGFSIRVERWQESGDDTALNGIRLLCSKDGKRNYLYSVESHSGYFGEWSQPQYCPVGVLTSFQLRVESALSSGDDTAANNIKFRCSSNPLLEGPGMGWGEYGSWSQACNSGGICGIETKMEQYVNGIDNTSLNDVVFYCCDKH